MKHKIKISPSLSEERIFGSQTELNNYLSSPKAKAGQDVTLLDAANGKYKTYLIQGTKGSFETKPMGAGDYMGNALPAIAEGDTDTNYYVYDSEEDIYRHYRFNGTKYVIVGGNSYSKVDMDEKLKDYGVSMELNGNEISLLNEDGETLGDKITIPTQGITNLKAEIATEIEDSETVAYLELYDNLEGSGEPITRVKLPQMGGGISSDSYSVRLYNRTGKSTTFTTSANGATNIVFSFHENDPDGVQTSQSGNITIHYKDSSEPDSSYKLLRSITIPQDTNTSVDVSKLLSAGSTTNVRVTAYGTDITNIKTLTFNIKCVEISISSVSSDFPNDELSHSVFKGNANLNYVPIGSGIQKTMHIEIDGTDITEPFSIGTSHRTTLGYTLPITSLSYGVHYLRYYFTTDEGAISNILNNVIFYDKGDSKNTMIGIDKSVNSVTYGEPIDVKFVVITPDKDVTESVTVSLLDSEDNVIKTSSLSNVSPTEMKTISFDSNVYGQVGIFKVRVQSGSIRQTHTITVTELETDYNINPITNGLVYYFNAAGHTNSDSDKEEFVYVYDSKNIYAENTDFNWATNGYVETFQTDDNGNNVSLGTALRINGAARHTIQLPIFSTRFTNKDGNEIRLDSSTSATPTTNGRTIEFDYRIPNATNDSEVIIECANTTNAATEKFVGIKITPLTCCVKSNNMQAGTISDGFITDEEYIAAAYLQKGRKVHLSFVIEGLNTQASGKQAVNIYVNGKYANSIPYTANDNFTHDNYIKIGSDNAIVDIYNIRAYNRSLTRAEIQQNYYASQNTIDNRLVMAEFNDVCDDNGKVSYDKAIKRYRCLKLKGETSPSKSARRYAGVTLTMPDNGDDGYLTLLNLNGENPNYTPDLGQDDDNYIGRFYSSNKVQGTSSQRFIRKNYKIYLVDDNGSKVKFPLKGYSDGTFIYDASKKSLANSIPESTLCFKMDYMSKDHANTYNANMADSMFSDLTPAQIEDSRVQNTVYGFSCLLFIENPDTGEITFAGDGMLNNDKGNAASFGLKTEGDSGNVTKRQKWEFLNNTEDICNFKTDKLQATKPDGKKAVLAALESCYPDQGDLEDEGLTPNYDYIQVLFTWLCQRANFWDETDADLKAIKKQRFINEFEKHFNLNHALTYYCFIYFTALVDNRAKNMFLKCEDVTTENLVFTGEQTSLADCIDENGNVDVEAIDWEKSTFAIWYTDLYDLDSCFGAENSGYLRIPYYADWDYVISVDSEGTPLYGFNGYQSRLWLMIEDAMPDKIKAQFQSLTSSGKLTYQNFYNQQIKNGTALTCGAIGNTDMEYKYNDPWILGYTNENGQFIYTSDYKYMQRDRELQKEMFLYKRSQLLYSQFQTTQFNNDHIAFRSAVSSDTALPITIKALQYIYPAIGLNSIQTEDYSYPDTGALLLAPNAETTISRTIGSTDNIFVYSASNLTKLDISDFKPYEININNATNLRELILGKEIGSHTFNPGTLNFAGCPMLEVLNIGGCQSETGIDLSNKNAIREIYAKNSKITDITLPNGGLLTTLHLPATMTKLILKNQSQLTDYSCQGYSNVTYLDIENTSGIPVFDIVLECLDNLKSLRLVGINENLGNDDNDILHFLLSDDIKGKYLDANGITSDDTTKLPYISGKITVNRIGSNLKERLEAAYPDLTISSPSVYTQYTVEFKVDGKTVDTAEADTYNDFTVAYNESGLLDNFPYKASVGTHYYLFKQWNLKTPSGGIVTATATENTISGIASNIVATAEFYDCTLPSSPREVPAGGYLYWNTYADGDNADRSKSAYSTAEFYALCMGNVIEEQANGYFTVGSSQIRIDLLDPNYSNGRIIFDIVALQHYEIAARPGQFANIVFACHETAGNHHMNPSNTNVGGWDKSNMRSWLNSTMWEKLPANLRAMITSVNIMTTSGGATSDPAKMVTSVDNLFLFSIREVFNDTSYTVYQLEVNANGNPDYYSFPFFVNNNKGGYRIKYAPDSTSAQWWWLRTPEPSSSNGFRGVHYTGGSYNSSANYSYGVVFGFCIGIPQSS